MNSTIVKEILDRKVTEYNKPSFIARDPISVPHRFTRKQDIEIAAFFAAIFAWGNRTTIINKSLELMTLMDNSPHDFLLHHTDQMLKRFLHFRHRTFNAHDALYFIHFLAQHYRQHNSLEQAFMMPPGTAMKERLSSFHRKFFSLEHLPRTEKHISTPERHSACKRLNMFLRWMVRKDNGGVDFGIWRSIPAAELICPLDVHVCNVAYRLGLTENHKADWKAAELLTAKLRQFDPHDPVKYDFALFALGVDEKFR